MLPLHADASPLSGDKLFHFMKHFLESLCIFAFAMIFLELPTPLLQCRSCGGIRSIVFCFVFVCCLVNFCWCLAKCECECTAVCIVDQAVAYLEFGGRAIACSFPNFKEHASCRIFWPSIFVVLPLEPTKWDQHSTPPYRLPRFLTRERYLTPKATTPATSRRV